MELTDQTMSSKQKVTKQRNSKARYVCEFSSSENKSAMLKKLGSHQKSSPTLHSVCDKDATIQSPGEQRGRAGEEERGQIPGQGLKTLTEMPGLNPEKSTRDLQRCSASIARYRGTVKVEVETSVRNIKTTFAELYRSLIDRESQLTSEVERVTNEALEILVSRQKKAEDLKRVAELSSHQADVQLSELRAQIKDFVSERKHDEQLGRSARVFCDAEQLKRQITQCGEVSHPKNNYSTRTASDIVLSTEHQSVTGTKRKVHKRYTARSLHRSNYSTGVKSAADPKCDITTDPRGATNQLTGNDKQGAENDQRRKFVPKYQSTRLKGPVRASNVEDGLVQNINPKPRCDGVRMNTKQRGASHKEQKTPQNMIPAPTEHCHHSRYAETINCPLTPPPTT